MYGKDESRNIRKEFWTVFGQMMKPHLSSEGRRVKWINYPTGIKSLRFSMDANQFECRISIDIVHRDPEIRELFWEQLSETKSYLHASTGFEWEWIEELEHYSDQICRVQLILSDVNIFKKEDWPKMFEFLKIRLMALDEWWNDIKHLFEPLKD